MKCPICDQTDKWENVDRFRLKPSDMSLCMSCGFVGYPKKYKSEQEAKDYYRTQYRSKAPSVMNLYTSQRKLHYHAHFLRELIEEWKAKGIEAPVICEVGAAMGMALHWFKTQVFPKAEVCGTEFDLYMRRNAWHEWKVRLDEDFDTSKKYDFIMSYKVAEHQLDVDKRLREYAECLTETGVVYISVPIWFGTLNNFGKSGFDLEYYYHPDHINVWSEKVFETLLKKVGLEVIKKNTTYYDHTYLCKRNDELMKVAPEYEKPETILEKLDLIFKANTAGLDGDYDKAVEIYPNFPYAHEGRYEKNRSKIHALGFDFISENYLKKALNDCPDSGETRVFVADICMRYERYKDCIQYAEDGLEMKPENPVALRLIMHSMSELAKREKDPVEKERLIKEARKISRYMISISKQDEPDAISWCYQFNSLLKAPHEQAKTTSNPSRVDRAETIPGHRGEVNHSGGPQP